MYCFRVRMSCFRDNFNCCINTFALKKKNSDEIAAHVCRRDKLFIYFIQKLRREASLLARISLKQMSIAKESVHFNFT